MKPGTHSNKNRRILLYFRLFSATAFLLMFSSSGFSQGRNTEELEIKTSAQCPMCKESIEKMLTFERGVRNALLDMETKKVTVRYNSRRTNPDNLRKAINKLGYDADDKEGDPEAYSNLPACCKKPGDPDHVSH
jgi:periplasmic mercuric ion binding protein